MNSQYDQIFLDAYNHLNVEQKKAVDAIEGPVLTIAGPGTGKTQLLAIRIGKILNDTDTSPHNILCLTYTEAGVVAMRKRLLEFIGPEAYKVHIHTFHSFCNSIIKENIDAFSDFGDLEAISDLEKVELMQDLIDSFPINHPLKRLKGNIYYEKDRLGSLFSEMKKEGWTVESIKEAIDKHRENILEDPEFHYKRKQFDKTTNITYQKGDVNPNKVEREMSRYQKLLPAAEEFEHFQKLMLKKGRFDFDDMILWVNRKFKEDANFLANYQERFQYILVDEYQDTNGTQNELLFQLSDYWDNPNLFVVGDDDQAIYRFQGANVANILEFKLKYDPLEIVLTQNYRSTQAILDTSKKLIDCNIERLVSKYDHLSKDLKAAKPQKDSIDLPALYSFDNEKQEEAYLVNKIESLHDQGVEYENIAVIYRGHKDIENVVRYLQFKKIPFKLKKKEDVLSFPIIKKMISILAYIGSEYIYPDQDSGRLFEIMNYNEFGLKIRDNGKISYHCYTSSIKENPVKWRDVIADKEVLATLGIEKIEETLFFSEIIEGWIQAIPNFTLQVLMEKIMTESGLLDAAMRSPDATINLQALNIFFEFVKKESVRNPQLNPETLMDVIQNMNDNKIYLSFDRIYNAENGVNLMTAHGSKGLEFEHVFVIKLTENNWVKKKNNLFNYSYPPTLFRSVGADDIEDDRRLLYVALTRTKDKLYLTSSKANAEDKELTPSQFLAEIDRDGLEKFDVKVEEKNIQEFLFAQMKPVEKTSNLIDNGLVASTIDHIKINPTGLSKYLRCPLSFYFENILRVPMARTASMGYGNAIHHALDRYFSKIEKDPNHKIGPVDDMFYFFKEGMDKFRSHFTLQEYEDLSIHGKNTLNSYYETYKDDWAHVRNFLSELKIDGIYNDTPITGRIDMIKVYDNKTSVIDFKTGKYDSKKLALPSGPDDDNGSDYWRQMVMYKMLLDQDPRNNYKMDEGFMDFVEPKPDGTAEKPKRFVVDQWEIEKVGKELIEVYGKITKHVFEPGCGKPDCKWCSFVGDNEMLLSPLETEYEEDN